MWIVMGVMLLFMIVFPFLRTKSLIISKTMKSLWWWAVDSPDPFGNFGNLRPDIRKVEISSHTDFWRFKISAK